jgi:hypothetical protein
MLTGGFYAGCCMLKNRRAAAESRRICQRRRGPLPEDMPLTIHMETK